MEKKTSGLGIENQRPAADRPPPRRQDCTAGEGASSAGNELHRLCVEAAPYGIMIHDSQGRIFLFNPQLEAITGYNRSEIPDIDSWLSKLYPDPAYRALVMRARRTPSPEESIRTREVMITRKNGRKRMCRFTSTIRPNGLRVVYVRDIHASAETVDAPFHTHPLLEEPCKEGIAPSYTWQYVRDDFQLIGYNHAAENLGDANLPACLAAKSSELYAERPDIAEDIRRCFAAKGSVRRRYAHGLGKSEPGRIFEATFNYRPPDAVVLRLEDLTDLYRTEAKLHESERKFIEFADLLPEIVFETDLEGRILFINRNGPVLLGVDRDELLTQENPFNFVRPEDRARAAANFRRVISGEDIGPNEYRLRRRDGSHFTALIRSSLIMKDGKPSGVRGFIIDITERKRMEEALRASEKKFALAFHASPGGFAITTFNEGRYIDASAGECRMTGYRREELIGRSVFDLNIWADPEDGRRLRRLLEKQGVVENHEYRFRRKDGDIRTGLLMSTLVELDGERCIIGESIDLTDLRRTEEALRVSEQKFSTAFHAGAGAFAIVTLATGRFIDLNEGVCEMTGYSREDLLEKSIFRLKIWADPDDRRRLGQQLLDEGIVRNYDFKFRRKSGELRSGLISAALIELGGERCMISEAIDLTERHQAEAALQRAHDELEQRVRERTEDLLKSNRRLQQQIERRRKVEKDLRAKEKQLKRKTNDVLEVNSALKVLLRKREEDRREVEERISSHLKDLVVPYIEKLKRRLQSPRQKAHLGVIEQNLRGMAAPFTQGVSDKLYNLTPAEIQVANFIKLDKSNKEIADVLDVSVKTIEYHRYSIRRKLGLINKPINLRSFLKAMK